MIRPRTALLVLLVTVLLPVGTAGCWDRRELDMQIHVLSGFMDLEEDGMVRLTVEALGLRAAGAATESTHHILSARGVTPGDAAWRMTMMAEAPLNWFHMELMVFGEAMARAGLSPVIDSMLQSYDVRRTVYLVTVAGRASDLLSSAMTSSRHSEQLLGMVENATTMGADGMRTTVNGFRRELVTDGIDPATHRIILVPAPDITHSIHGSAPAQAAGEPGDGAGQGDQGGGHEAQPLAMLNGMAVFDEDRLVGFAEEREALGLEWLMSPIRGRHIWAPVGTGMDGIGLWVYNSERRIHVRPRADGELQIEIVVGVEFDIEEFLTGGDMASPADVMSIEEIVSRRIEEEIADGIAYVVEELGADPVGFGREISRRNPDLWASLKHSWPEALRQADFAIDCRASLVSTGMLRQKRLPQAPGATPR